MGIVFCLMFQQEAKTQTQLYYRMIFEMFGERHGGGASNLHQMIFLSYRGYWTSMLDFSMLLIWGTAVVSTVV